MKNEEKEKYMRKFVLEMKIDDSINKVNKTIQDAWDYFQNPTSIIEEDDLSGQLDEAEMILKNLKDLIDKLQEEYENDIKELENDK